MIKAGGAWSGRQPGSVLQGVQAEMVMVGAGRYEGGDGLAGLAGLRYLHV